MGVAAARKQAFAFDPRAASASADAGTFKAVAEKWIQHYVDEKELISKPEIVRHLQRYVYPRWAGTQFFEIRRSTVNELLDAIVERHGAPQADGVLATLRSIMNWYQTRDENYVSPIVKGMRRDQRRPTDRKRDRTLTDDEIRAVWTAAGESPFGGIVKLLLLTAQRREKVITMKRDDISDDGVWTIATERPREKGTGGTLKLPEVALDIIHSQPIIDDNPYVFPGSLRGRRSNKSAPSSPPTFNSWSQRKEELDAKLPKRMPDWTLHDLRRTARSLLARCGVGDAIAERVLGHAISGVQGVYNRHSYVDEKADALARLATLIDQIVNPPDTTNIVPLKGKRAARSR
jgi:integrase